MFGGNKLYTIIFLFLTVVITGTSSMGHKPWSVPRLGKCDEDRARLLKLIRQNYQDVELPLCDVDGWYLPRYYCMWTGVCFCVDRRGRHIVARGGRPHLPAIAKSHCNEHRAKALEQIKAGITNVEVPECDYHGDRYKAGYSCCKGTCYCLDEFGKKTPIDMSVQERRHSTQSPVRQNFQLEWNQRKNIQR